MTTLTSLNIAGGVRHRIWCEPKATVKRFLPVVFIIIIAWKSGPMGWRKLWIARACSVATEFAIKLFSDNQGSEN
jgi:hypothetical protein